MDLKKRAKQSLAVLLSVLFVFLSLPMQIQGATPSVPTKKVKGDFLLQIEQQSTIPEGYTGIYTKEDLDNVRNNLAGNYILMNDIHFNSSDFGEGNNFYNDGRGWLAIGGENSPFTGIFDGNGYEITNIAQTPNDGYGGVFAKNSGTIKNLGIRDFFSNLNQEISMDYTIGIIAGVNDNTVENCFAKSSYVAISCNEGNTYQHVIGGIVGKSSNGSIRYCSNDCYLSCVDGILGGIVGKSEKDSISYCSNLSSGTVFGKYIGGIAGSIAGSKINECYNAANLNSGEVVGGIAGKAQDAGDPLFPNIISNVYSYMEIFGDVNTSVGGILGEQSSGSTTLSCCYQIGGMSAQSAAYRLGAILGSTGVSASVSIEDCYFAKSEGSTLTGSGEGVLINGTIQPLNLEEMKESSSFTGFDFSEIWTTDSDAGYLFPKLRKVSTIVPDRIEITTPPSKTTYYQKEELVLEDMVITAFYRSGESAEIVDYTVSGYNTDQAGTQTVTISYEGKSVQLSITVVEVTVESIELSSAWQEKIYMNGMIPDLSQEELTIYYSDNSVKQVLLGEGRNSNFQPSEPGSYYIFGKPVAINVENGILSISYEGATADYPISYSTNTAEHIKILSGPMEPNGKGLELEVTNNDNTTYVLNILDTYLGFGDVIMSEDTATYINGGYALTNEGICSFECSVTKKSNHVLEYSFTLFKFDEQNECSDSITENLSQLSAVDVAYRAAIQGAYAGFDGSVNASNCDWISAFIYEQFHLWQVYPDRKIPEQELKKLIQTYFCCEDADIDFTSSSNYDSETKIFTVPSGIYGNSEFIYSDTIAITDDGEYLITYLQHIPDPDPAIKKITVLVDKNITIKQISFFNPEFIGIATPALKTEYYVGDTKLDTSGLSVLIRWPDNFERIISHGLQPEFDFRSAGKKSITMNISGCPLSYEITVREVLQLTIDSEPQKLVYYIGDTLDLTGLQVTATFADGTSRAVTDYVVSGFQADKEGPQEIALSCGNKTISFPVTVVAKTLTGISVTPPNKTTYLEGQPLDLTGLIVNAQFNGNTSEVVTEYNVTGYDPNTLGEQTITITYQDTTATFAVTVVSKSLTEITLIPPSKTEYFVGESFDTAGLVVTAHYNNGASQQVNDYAISGFDANTAGQQTITITYQDTTATFAVTVVSKSLTEITLIPPSKTEYFVGESFDTAGLIVTAHYNNGASQQVNDYAISGFDANTAGQQTITITYQDKTAAFVVSVKSRVPDKITSGTCGIVNNCLTNLQTGTSVAVLLSRLNEGQYIQVFNHAGIRMDHSATIGTGMVVKLMDGSTVKQSLTIVVTGDTNGDGNISITDMIAVKSHILNKNKLRGSYGMAADTNGDSNISITDFIQIKSHILGKGGVKPHA